MRGRDSMRGGLAGLIALALAAQIAAAQQPPAPKAGVVTTLQGTATVSRTATPEPQPLKFKDDVFLQDRVTAGDRSLARILLGGKAIVTVRERSSLTITEVPGAATIDLTTGAIAVAVARERLRPGETVQIRTPNAIAGIRGTVVIAEVVQETPQSDPTTAFTVLRGVIEVLQLDAQRRPFGPAHTLNVLQRLSLSGLRPPGPPQTLSPAQAAQAASGFKTNIKEAPPAANTGVNAAQMDAAAATETPAVGPSAVEKLTTQKTPSPTTVPTDQIRNKTLPPAPPPAACNPSQGLPCGPPPPLRR